MRDDSRGGEKGGGWVWEKVRRKHRRPLHRLLECSIPEKKTGKRRGTRKNNTCQQGEREGGGSRNSAVGKFTSPPTPNTNSIDVNGRKIIFFGLEREAIVKRLLSNTSAFFLKRYLGIERQARKKYSDSRIS